ncbi:acetyl-CoA carboxylase biotin carboxylase subunit [bacterium]|nr:acetyl-CoA carboxylase biotin carboxylase subunit [bacterium]MBU0899824.1 acetyl-CoA carboxylase biotin carboxylase subunit [bacterium]MBU1152372.1 acetyl-CoA carboxylase biotin carboxylase subunit [bacterium]MBU1782323.1 acetyl-CoA carboxylase biotin carboxylase subunit [bacterium]MBU2599835.1 acetyl-CoA carboxylase biotin carboxylase subunit [bacterium]
MFKKILVANRGEIALRVIRAAKELGIATVAIYSQADEDSLHVRFADEAVCIGPPSSKQSYLNIPAIISAAEITGVEAIHPGYGFLAENATFADICEEHLFKFIGPNSESMRMMGDKAIARKKAVQAGVIVVPGTDVITSPEEAAEKAKEIGYPIIIKAVAGGGGKGMRIVYDKAILEENIDIARREAESAFGNDSLYLEKYIEKPVHVEVQVLGDNYGNVIHLGERDCSIQYRHQKLIEESPSPNVDEKLRSKLGKNAIKIAKAIKYTNAGTVEFILDEKKRCYFMEMNTRIQVEHPVTEMVTGIDLVKEQIRLAYGEKLGISQNDICIKGHAVECRITAQDMDNNLSPNSGVITSLNIPGGPGIRVDTHIYTGYKIPSYYDALMAKLIGYGQTREEAILHLLRALDEFIIEGVKTTISLHKKILSEENFRKGNIHTHYLSF